MSMDNNLFDMELERISEKEKNSRLLEGPLYKRYFFRFIELIKRKKKEQITVMFIPHNEKKIRSTHLSNLSLNIIIGVVSIIVVISAILIVQHNGTVKEVDKLIISQKDAKIQFSKIKGEIQEISSLYSVLRQKLDTLQSLTGGKKARQEFSYGVGGGDVLNEDGVVEEQAPDSIPSEIYLMNRITNDMSSSEEVIDSIKGYLKKRSKVISSTPTLWPVTGSVVNPFGLVRNSHNMKLRYNSGVDISTIPGSPVISTAPGVVVSVKNDHSWQYIVRIRHSFGYETIYKGLQQVSVAVNDKVSKGSPIGTAGMSPSLSDSIVNYQIYIGSEAQNPLPYLSYIQESEK